MTTATTAQIADGLRAWAAGLLPLEAAVELLARAHGGRFLTGPWVRPAEGGGWWLDAAQIAEAGYLSGGERRLLAVVASLADFESPVSLTDVLPGLDRASLALVLAAMAHAAGQTLSWDKAARA